MLTKTNKIKCDFCGRFISYDDLRNGEAHHVFTPDSHFTVESMELFCKKCNNEEK